MANTPKDSSLSVGTHATPREKPVVIGIYGVPGCGKSFLLNELKKIVMAEEQFAFYDESKMIDSMVPGRLRAVRARDEHTKMKWRQSTIEKIGEECVQKGCTGIVAGHFMLWAEKEEVGETVWTAGDLNTFTHILYLDVDAELVAKRRADDTSQERPVVSVGHLCKWQKAEKDQLRSLCRNKNILFSAVSAAATSTLHRVVALLRDFRLHSEKYNVLLAQRKITELFDDLKYRPETVLVLDADKTLVAEDTGYLFWELYKARDTSCEDQPLTALISYPLEYSYSFFRQATLWYEEKVADELFETICQDVASAVSMHADFVELLRRTTQEEHVSAVVVTSGLRRVWELVLEKEGLSDVKVVGGGRISDGFVVTAQVKAGLIAQMQDVYGTYVWAFGGDPLDMGMLGQADEAIVVVGKEKNRSRVMDKGLYRLRARRALLPSTAPPRLGLSKLPVVQLTERSFLDEIFKRRSTTKSVQVHHATDKNAAKILMTAMCDEFFAGAALRDAHRRIGWYLATEFLAEIIGLEEYKIAQRRHATGYRIAHEQETAIVAVMRGGEPMAFGVSDALPLSMFVHAQTPEDFCYYDLQGKHTIVLVDSMINSGKTVVEYLNCIRAIDAKVRVVAISGVTQRQSISQGDLSKALADDAKFSLITLRLSDDNFTGEDTHPRSKATYTAHTGNRLFNTNELEWEYRRDG